MNLKEVMELERRKAVVRALAELEIAVNTFYSDGNFEDLNSIYEQLVKYKELYLD